MPSKQQGLLILAVILLTAGAYELGSARRPPGIASTPSAGALPPVPAAGTTTVAVIHLTDPQMHYVKTAAVSSLPFGQRVTAVGNIDFNQDRQVQVYAPWQGRILRVMAQTGDQVAKGAPLFSSAGTRQLAARTLERSRALLQIQGITRKEVDQAVSDQQAAEAAYQAARAAVHLFGKSEAQIDHIIQTRQIDPEVLISSPITGTVTARNAAPGLFVQAGSTPAPFVVSDLSTVWLIADVAETDIPLVKVGQTLDVKVDAYPNKNFSARVTTIGAASDPNTHRVTVRAIIADPQHMLHPQMLATFTIHTGKNGLNPAIPATGIVRESDGAMAVWVPDGANSFSKRYVHIGQEQNGYVEITEGLTPGETVVTDGALFLNNAAAGPDQ